MAAAGTDDFVVLVIFSRSIAGAPNRDLRVMRSSVHNAMPLRVNTSMTRMDIRRQIEDHLNGVVKTVDKVASESRMVVGNWELESVSIDWLDVVGVWEATSQLDVMTEEEVSAALELMRTREGITQFGARLKGVPGDDDAHASEW